MQIAYDFHSHFYLYDSVLPTLSPELTYEITTQLTAVHKSMYRR